MSSIQLSVQGQEQIARKLKGIPAALTPPVILELLQDAGEPMRRTARQRAPRSDSAPHMADSIAFGLGRSRGPGVMIVLGPGRKFFYGRFQEYGTVHHVAQPFLRPAFDTQSATVTRRMGRATWRLVARKAAA